MVVLIHYQFLHQPVFLPPRSNRRRRIRFSVPSSAMDDQTKRRRFMEFPHVRDSIREVMVDLVSTMESRLDSFLLPSTIPPDVQFFQNHAGTSQGALHLRSGDKDKLSPSPIDFILGNWLHSELPAGALDINTLTAYLNTSTDAPGFLIEMMQSNPTSMLLFLDLLPRKELVLYPDYIDTFYGETELDARRQRIHSLPEVRPYHSSSLYVRCIFSPTPISVSINCEDDVRLDEIIRGHVGPIAKEVLELWLDRCACGGREVGERERAELERRDRATREKGFEIDLVNNIPKMFGPEVSSRILGALRGFFIKT